MAPPAAEKSGSTAALAWRLWREFLSRYRGKLGLALIAMALYAGSAAAIPAGVEWINATLSGSAPSLKFLHGPVLVVGPAIILALGLVNALSQYVQGRLTASAALSSLRDMQAVMFEKLLRLDDAQLRALGAGQSIGRLTNDATVLRETLMRTLTALRDLLTLLSLLGVMFWYDPVLFLVVAGIYALIGWPVARIGAHLRKSSRAAQEQTGEVASIAAEAVAGGRMIRTYNLENREMARGQSIFDARLSTLQRMARLRALNEPFIFMVGSAALALVVAVVALRIKAGALNIAEFISFIIALLMLSAPARGLSTLNAVAQEGFGAFERMLALIDMKPSIKDRPDAKPLKVADGAVAFRDISFAYDGAGAALSGFSLEVPAGKTVALVGESGAGKSTVFNLLTRLYEPQEGAIEIDGANISDVTLASLREAIAVVSQEAILFDDTIAANISFGRQGASEADIISAAKAAAADKFINALPQGYETRVGEAGGKLSGGERQRIAIARAFLKNAPILLLDEATSALDAESESLVQEALQRLARGRTTIVIAHRMSTIRNADLIVAMGNGHVIEAGAHDALIEKSGYFAKVAKMQAPSA